MNLFAFKKSKDMKSLTSSVGFFHSIGRDPYTDWLIILVVAIVAGAVMLALGFLTYTSAAARLNADNFTASADTVKFDDKALTKLLSQFDARAAERTKLKKTYDGPGDPSI